MFGPLGFNEIIFILVLGFLMLGPRQMALFSRTLGEVMGRLYRATSDARRLFEEERRKLEEDMSEVTAPMREAKEQWGSLKGELKKGLNEVESGIRQEKQDLEQQQKDALQAESSSSDASLPDLSRRKFLGDFEGPDDEKPVETAAASDNSETSQMPQIRIPEGQLARGSIAPVSADVETTDTASGSEEAEPPKDADDSAVL